MREVWDPHQDGEAEPTLADVSHLPFAELLRPGNLVLDNAMRRALRDMDRPGDRYAAHSSTP